MKTTPMLLALTLVLTSGAFAAAPDYKSLGSDESASSATQDKTEIFQPAQVRKKHKKK